MVQNSRSPHPAPGAGRKRYPALAITRGAPASIQGRRRPKRVVRRSESAPITGSVTMSQSRASSSTTPTVRNPRPRSTA